MKIHVTPQDIPPEPLIDADALTQAGHTLVESADDADVIISLCTYGPRNFLNHNIKGTNVIMVSMEPLLGRSMYAVGDIYKQSRLYHSVFRFGPCDSAERSFPVTEDPISYPYHPYHGWRGFRRADTTLRKRRVFFAGMLLRDQLKDGNGRVGLYTTRARLVGDLPHHGVNIYAEGAGFGNDTSRNGFIKDWDTNKLKLAQKVQADFHLCMENCRFENYISEKIHHGFQSDLVVLYLGNPDIAKWVPREAFIDLSEYYDPKRKLVNAAAVADTIQSMTQEEYDRILHAAREWRDTADFDARFAAQARRLTQKIIDRIREVGANADHIEDVRAV